MAEQTFHEFWSGGETALRTAIMDRGFNDGDVDVIAAAVRRRCEGMPLGMTLNTTKDVIKDVGDQVELHVHEVLSFFFSKVLDAQCEIHLLRNWAGAGGARGLTR